MANIRISQLPAASTLTGAELVPLVQNGQTVQTPISGFSATFTFTQTFLTIGNQSSTLPGSRYIAVSTGLTGTDGGAGNPYTLSISNTGVSAGTYTFPTITVNAQGQITAASSNTGEITSISFGTTGLTPNTPTTGSVVVAGTLATTNGGTGLTSFTSGGAVYATSSSALTTGTLPSGSGGTGLTSFTSGGAVYATSTSALTTGTLPVASGGTGITTLTAGYIPYGNGTGAFASNSSFTFTGTTLYSPTLSVTSTISTTPNLTFNASNSGFTSGANVAGSYLQTVIQNSSSTAGASTNYVLSNDLGTDSSYYGEFGMNSSGYSGAGVPVDFFSINNGVYFSAHNGDIAYGAGTANKSYFTFNSGLSAHVINNSGAIGLNTNLAAGTGSGTTGFGTAGQVMITQGSASAPTWGNVAGGGF